MTEHLSIYGDSVHGWTVAHNLTHKPIATFKTLAAADRFRGEIKDLDWDFDDPHRTPSPTWSAVRAALRWRGVKI
mgnify:FL=1